MYLKPWRAGSRLRAVVPALSAPSQDTTLCPPPETSDVAPKVRSPRERSQGKEGRLDLH